MRCRILLYCMLSFCHKKVAFRLTFYILGILFQNADSRSCFRSFDHSRYLSTSANVRHSLFWGVRSESVTLSPCYCASAVASFRAFRVKHYPLCSDWLMLLRWVTAHNPLGRPEIICGQYPTSKDRKKERKKEEKKKRIFFFKMSH